ncbi:class I SAM-dependent methyltransferase [Mucilaginibacter sp.]|uniref:class I SAM-dependent methyltransferase n=1 Tax=Mucilaginibacter sp. TaxID=1882438 RepID=UPI002620A87D|nr:class I SAM-dependent methyltransferase [Mucilaginibacter sp.]MDB4926276.1 methylase involved in ubiquinone/menaquinone biosynthesis [Mucilaginibacter sp.]
MIKQIKKAVRKSQNIVQKALAKNIDYLYEDSPCNKLMAELEKKEDYANYQQYTQFRKSFEKKILKVANTFSYVRMFGTLYHFNRFRNLFSLREACTDHTGLNSRMRFSLDIIKQYFPNAKKIYLTENDTAYHKNIANLNQYDVVTSIYKPGDILHQDLTCLTYSDNSFDLCLSFEDLEHIPDYKTVIKELYRVTKPGGHVLLSAPFIFENDKTITRATINDEGEVTHLLEPEYHGDPVLPLGILCYYHFGWDLLDTFKDAGFTSVKIVTGYDINKLILDTLLFIVAEK